MAFGDAGSYARFMGRFSEPLAPKFAGVLPELDGRLLDVGCGPGVLTAELVRRHGADRVDAIDPTPGFVAAARARCPGVDVRQGTAEELPYADDVYAASYAQLVVHFMKDPVRGLSGMARVTEPGGAVAVCVWDHGGGRGPLSLFWDVARELDPAAHRRADASPGSHEGDLQRLMTEAGLDVVAEGELSVTIELASFEDWWAPFEEPAGSVGDYLAARTPEQISELRERCRTRLPEGSFELTVWTWTSVGRVRS
jgi:trans-aconitate methyltransferase